MTKSKIVLLAPVLALLGGAVLQGCGNGNSGAAGSGGSVGNVGTGGAVGQGGDGNVVGAGGNGGSPVVKTPKVTIVGSGS